MMRRLRARAAVLVASSLALGVLGSFGPPLSADPGLRLARDLAPPDAAAADEPAPAITQRYPFVIPRSDSDRPDEREGSLLHLVYLLPAGAPDERLDQLGVLEDSMRAQNAWFADRSGGYRWRLDTFTFQWDDPATQVVEKTSRELVDVTFARSSLPASELSEGFAVAAELRNLGLSEPDKRYLSYVASDGAGACGDSIYSIPADPNERIDGKYAQVFLDSAPGCMARHFAPDAKTASYTEAIAQHEVAHNDSAAWVLAPRTCRVDFGAGFGHVCTLPFVLASQDPERFDLLFPFTGLSLEDKMLDIGHDDYFAHPWPYRDLDESVYLVGP